MIKLDEMTNKQIRERMRSIRREVGRSAKSIPYMQGAFLQHFESIAKEHEELKNELESRYE